MEGGFCERSARKIDYSHIPPLIPLLVKVKEREFFL
jgi:hypothetical protein